MKVFISQLFVHSHISSSVLDQTTVFSSSLLRDISDLFHLTSEIKFDTHKISKRNCDHFNIHLQAENGKDTILKKKKCSQTASHLHMPLISKCTNFHTRFQFSYSLPIFIIVTNFHTRYQFSHSFPIFILVTNFHPLPIFTPVTKFHTHYQCFKISKPTTMSKNVHRSPTANTHTHTPTTNLGFSLSFTS